MNMYEKRIKLRELLNAKDCTPLMGAYDVLSAKIIEQTGFPVVYTGSFVTGASRGALPDVGLVQLHDLLELAREIAKETNIPIVCDADTGWYHAANIWRTVHEFESAGASAIHIEDTVFGKHTTHKAVSAGPGHHGRADSRLLRCQDRQKFHDHCPNRRPLSER